YKCTQISAAQANVGFDTSGDKSDIGEKAYGADSFCLGMFLNYRQACCFLLSCGNKSFFKA
ncbi:MAG: hypothetical protein LBF13_04055, partial [Campylobacteraceae bacterium]|nr:hypothetical protein [Campylobacteraceae bacterium]